MLTTDPNTSFPLNSAKRAVTLMVADVKVDGPDAMRLQAMGICRGRRIELVKSGDPLIVRVLGSRVGLSGRLAAEVLVRLADTPLQPPAPAHSRVA